MGKLPQIHSRPGTNLTNGISGIDLGKCQLIVLFVIDGMAEIKLDSLHEG